MTPEEIQKEIVNVSDLTEEEFLSDLGPLMELFEYSDLKGSARNIAVRYRWVAIYIFRTNEDHTQLVFDVLLDLLKSRNNAIYAALIREQCECAKK